MPNNPCRNAPKLFLFVLFWMSVFAPASSADDWGSSHNLLLKADLDDSLGDEWFVLSRSNLALRNDNEQTFLKYTGASLGYQIDRQWSVRLGFRLAQFRIRDDWRTERRPIAELYFADAFDGWRLTSRSRVEYRDRTWSNEDVRLRQEFTATAPWQFTSLGLKPFLEEELFYSTRNDWFEANWATAGLSLFPKKGVKLKLAYRHNRQRIFGNFTTRHTLVTGINVYF
jgi:hypothetical protein